LLGARFEVVPKNRDAAIELMMISKIRLGTYATLDDLWCRTSNVKYGHNNGTQTDRVPKSRATVTDR
jgi:hypothetical protein